MFNKNTFSTGLIIGVFLPILFFPILYGMFVGLESIAFMSDEGFRPMFKERTTAIVSIAMNAVALNYYQKRKFGETMRGIVIPTFIYVVIWLFIFGETILNAQ